MDQGNDGYHCASLHLTPSCAALERNGVCIAGVSFATLAVRAGSGESARIGAPECLGALECAAPFPGKTMRTGGSMTPPRQEDLFGGNGADRDDQEGLFDAQLSLPLPEVAAPEPFPSVIKRDGRREPFDKRKIADAIFKAAQSIGGQDRDLALSLASAVTIYLTKRLGGQPPTVDHVHDAVERVLMQMAHVKTALAYARYRDRRARIRRLRQGDMRALLNELEEARQEREALGGHPGAALSVRTSEDTLTTWDRERIIAALTRETELEKSAAVMVALEVEQQIQKAGIQTLTTSLVRELVDAKLAEHGLLEHRARHQRLGVPLYDTEHIIRGATPDSAGRDPAGTDTVLARAVKKEYALARVFSTPVAEAHLRGDMHLHGLGLVDRLFAVEQSLACPARFGIGAPGGRNFAAPPKRPETLLAQMVKSSDLEQGCFSEQAGWAAVNVLFAPFLHGLPDASVAQFAQMLVYEYACRAILRSESAPCVEIDLHWRAPEWLANAEATGPGGASTGKSYRDYEHTAQQFAWAILELFRKGGADGSALPAPLPVVTIGEGFFRAPGHESFLAHAAGAAAVRKGIHFALEREAAAAHGAIWQPRRMALQQVTLNLPRAAYVSGTESALFAELDRLLQLAAMAHQEKRDFVESLAEPSGRAPLAALAMLREGMPYCDLDAAQCLVAVDGLTECVQTLLNCPGAFGPEAASLGERILAHLREQCREQGERLGLRLVLAQNNDFAATRRFAALDARAFPRTAASVMKTEPASQIMHYSMGVRIPPAPCLTPIDRVRIEGAFHVYLDWGAITEAALPLEHMSPEAISDFIKKAWRQTSNRRLVFR